MGLGRGPTNDDERLSVSGDFKCLGRGCGTRRGPTNDDDEFSVSAGVRCFRKGVWGWGGGPLMMMKDSLFLLISDVLARGCGAGEGAN